MKKGKFITFEGSEGCGKSTQSRLLCDHLKARGLNVKLVREPGGVVISEKVREILLDKKNTAMNKECETLLYMAARAQLVEEVVIPELQRRGLFRTEYEGRTLRENLGLPYPVNRHAVARAAVQAAE